MPGVNPTPYMQVRVAFPSNPLSGSYTYTDISSYVRKVSIRRGRQHVLNQFEAGTLTVLLDGRDGSFDPTNSSSTYYPNVTLNRRVEVRAWWNLLSATNGASIPTGQTLYNCTQNAGTGELTATAAGNMVASSATGSSGFPVTPGGTYYAQELFQTAATARSCFLTSWYYDSAGNFVASSNGAQITDASSGTTQATASSVAPPTARYGASGTTILSAASSEKHTQTKSQVAQASSAGTWYAGGGTPIFTGFTDSWAPQWKDNLGTDVTMTATDGFRLMALMSFGTGTYASTCIADGATNFWSMGDAPGSLYALDSIAGNNASANGTAAFGGTPVGVDPTTTAIPNANGADAYDLSAFDTAVPASSFSVEAWALCPTSTDGAVILDVFKCAPRTWTSIAGWYLYILAGPGGVVELDLAQPSRSIVTASSTNYSDGNWHHLVFTTNGAGTITTLYVDGASIGTFNPTGVVPAGAAFAEWGAFSSTGTAPGRVGWCAYYKTTTLSAAQVLNHYNIGVSGYSAELSSARITKVLGSTTWPTADTSIGTGISTVPANTSSFSGTSLLDYLQSISKAENGALFINGSGVVVFQGRHSVFTGSNSTSAATLGDGTGEIPFDHNPGFALDNIDFYLASNVTRSGGVMQSASTTATTYGAAPTLTESGLLLNADSESLYRAQWNVGHYQTPQARVSAVTINVLGDPVNWFPLTVFRELRDRVTVKRRPYTKAGGFPTAQYSNDAYIEGIAHEINPQEGTWNVTLNMSTSETQQYWVLGDSTFGVLGSTTRLAY